METVTQAASLRSPERNQDGCGPRNQDGCGTEALLTLRISESDRAVLQTALVVLQFSPNVPVAMWQRAAELEVLLTP